MKVSRWKCLRPNSSQTIDLDDDGFDLGEDMVKLVLESGEELDSDFDYTLKIKTEPKDLAGNKYEDEDDEWVSRALITIQKMISLHSKF